MVRHTFYLKKAMLGYQILHSKRYQESIWLFVSYQTTGAGNAQHSVGEWCTMHTDGSGTLVGRILCSLSILDSPRSSLFLLYLDPKKQFPRTDLLGRDIPPFRSWRDWMAQLLRHIAYPSFTQKRVYTLSHFPLHRDCGNVAGGGTSPIWLIRVLFN